MILGFRAKTNMIANNKLKLAILALLTSPMSYAITIDPVQIQSGAGELLYAEMNFRNAAPDQNIQVGLAQAEDLMSIGASHQPPGHLNFYTRRNARGEGVITITSNRPITENELNFIVKVQAGSTARLQHVRKTLTRAQLAQNTTVSSREQPLIPVMIVSEKDIALNLPVSTQYKVETPTVPTETLLNARQALPPALNRPNPTAQATEIAPASAPVVLQSPAIASALADTTPSTTPEATITTAETAAITQDQAPVSPASTSVSSQSSDPLVAEYQQKQQQAAAETQDQITAKAEIKAETVNTPAVPATSTDKTPQAQKHVVQSNESLWKIAHRVAQQQNRSVQDVMQQIKNQNEHAFIQGNANLLRRGAVLNLETQTTVNREQKTTPQLAKTVVAQPSQQSAKAKYRLNQAEMSLVAEKQQDSKVASATNTTQNAKTSKDLALKVMTAREKTVKLQRNVTQLELALNQKDHRIQLLNARLAELQNQLKAQQNNKQPKS